MDSLYLHVPFCLQKCRYCDFNSFAGLTHHHDRYVDALAREVGRWTVLLGRGGDVSTAAPLRTVYVGGGTPTLLGAGGIGRLLEASRRFGLAEDVEITVEANPGTVDGSLLGALRHLGVNRLSIGVQSFDDDLLSLLGRRHSATEAAVAFRAARRAGFDNVNLDFIYGIPTQDLPRWRSTLQAALALEPEHCSLYALSVEGGTPLDGDVAAGRLMLPDEDEVADMYVAAEELLSSAGYEHYEISNWALPGYRCRHNLTYWQNRPYLGCGAGAHSWLLGARFHNRTDPLAYAAAVETAGVLEKTLGGEAVPDQLLRLPWVAQVQPSSAEEELAETAILGLRLAEGVDLADLSARFQRDVGGRYTARCAELAGAGLLWRQGTRIGLTARGRLLGNEVFVRFLPSSPVSAG